MLGGCVLERFGRAFPPELSILCENHLGLQPSAAHATYPRMHFVRLSRSSPIAPAYTGRGVGMLG